MVKRHEDSPWVLLLVLLVVGSTAAAVALWLGDHLGIPNAGIIIAILLGTFFVCWCWALLRYLRWRDRRRAVAPVRPTYPDELEGTVYGLVPGGVYRVIQSFTDHYANLFQRGELLRFKERHFLPYHGGHTIVFEEKSLYLQDSENEELLANFSDYVERVER